MCNVSNALILSEMEVHMRLAVSVLVNAAKCFLMHPGMRNDGTKVACLVWRVDGNMRQLFADFSEMTYGYGYGYGSEECESAST